MELERRYVPVAESEIVIEERAAGAPIVSGISPPFNSKSVDLGGFREVFAESAFDKVLERYAADPKSVDVLGLFNHSEDHVLARTTSGTMELSKQKKGLGYAMQFPETAFARDLMVLVRRGDISGASFAFSVAPGGEQWNQDAKGNTTRTVTEVAGLYDVSIVSRPAYGSATVALRSLERWRSENLTDAERNEIAERATDAAADAARRTRIAAAAAIAKARHGLL